MGEESTTLDVLAYRQGAMGVVGVKRVAGACGLLGLASFVVPTYLAGVVINQALRIAGLLSGPGWIWEVFLRRMGPWILGGMLIVVAAWLLARSGVRKGKGEKRMGAWGILFVGVAGVYLLTGVAAGIMTVGYDWTVPGATTYALREAVTRILPAIADVMIVLLHVGAVVIMRELAARLGRPVMFRAAMIVLGFSGVAYAGMMVYRDFGGTWLPEVQGVLLVIGIATLAAQLGQLAFWPVIGVMVWRTRGRE